MRIEYIVIVEFLMRWFFQSTEEQEHSSDFLIFALRLAAGWSQ